MRVKISLECMNRCQKWWQGCQCYWTWWYQKYNRIIAHKNPSVLLALDSVSLWSLFLLWTFIIFSQMTAMQKQFLVAKKENLKCFNFYFVVRSKWGKMTSVVTANSFSKRKMYKTINTNAWLKIVWDPPLKISIQKSSSDDPPLQMNVPPAHSSASYRSSKGSFIWKPSWKLCFDLDSRNGNLLVHFGCQVCNCP